MCLNIVECLDSYLQHNNILNAHIYACALSISAINIHKYSIVPLNTAIGVIDVVSKFQWHATE